MNPLHFQQILASFLVGGLFVALQSFVAERVSARTAGVVLTIPSTIGISFFFIAWTLSPGEVPTIAPTSMMGLVSSLIFTLTYVAIAELCGGRRFPAIALCPIMGLGLWCVSAHYWATKHIVNLPFALLTLSTAATAAHLILNRTRHVRINAVKMRYSTGQKIARAIFSGAVIACSVWLAKAFGPFWGGVLAAFPASNLSALLILHWYHDSRFVVTICRAMPLGYSSQIVFILTSSLSFPTFGSVGGCAVAYAVTGTFILGLLQLLKLHHGIITTRRNRAL
ncbi:MAG: DUF3147 family protein [Proteobacteria bacterium]|nr:DUF3147 family protein [Pseudomonadota bacterium]